MTHLDLTLTPQVSAFPRFSNTLAHRLQPCLTHLRLAVGELLALGAFLAMCAGLMVEFS